MLLNYLLDLIQTPQLWHSVPGTRFLSFLGTRDFAYRIKIIGLKIGSLGDNLIGPSGIRWVLKSGIEKPKNQRDIAEERSIGVIQDVKNTQQLALKMEGGDHSKECMWPLEAENSLLPTASKEEKGLSPVTT